MKKILSLGLFALVITVATLAVAPFTLAQSTARTEAQCTIAKTRIEARTVKLETVRAAQAERYASIQTKFDTIVSSAEQNSFGTTTMVVAQEALMMKITAYTDAATAYSAALTSAKNVTCNTTNTELTAAIASARTALASLRDASTEVRTVVRGEVTDSLKEYATWLKDNATTEEEK